MKNILKNLTKRIAFLCFFLFGFLSLAQDIGVSNVILVEGTLNTSVSSVTYELCPTSSISLEIVLSNFKATTDAVSKVSFGISGVNSITYAEYTISNTIYIPGNSSVTITFPDDFNAVVPVLDFSNDGLSTITVSTTSVSSTGDTDTDNDAFYIVGKVFSTVTPSLTSPQNGIACQGEDISFSISPVNGTEYKFYVNGALAYQGSNTTITFSSDPTDVDALSNGDKITIGYTDSNGCEVSTSSVSQTVTIHSLPIATLDPGIGAGTVCDESEVTFTAGGGVEYEFYQGGVLVQAKSASNTYTTSGISNTQSITVAAFSINGCEDRETVVMNVLSISSAGSITFTAPTDSNICYGSSLTGTLSSTALAIVSHDLSYQWQSSNNGVDWSNIDGATEINYTPPALFQTTYFKRIASVSSNTLVCVEDGDSNTLTVTVDAPFSLSLSTPQPIYCLDEVIQFSATAGAVSYTFLINGISAQSSTTATLNATVSTTTSVASLTVKNNDIVTVIAEDTNGCTVSETLTVVSSDTPLNPSLTTDIPGNVICSGETVAITASGGTSYAFTLDGLAPQIGEVSGATFTTSRFTDGAVVEVTVSNMEGCTATTSMTFEVITLASAGTVTITDSSELEVCYDTALTATLSSTAAATSSDSVHYQWQSSTDGTSYVNVTGENSQNLDLSTLPNLTTTTFFRRQVSAYIDFNSNGTLDPGEITCTSGLVTLPIRIIVDDTRNLSISSSTGSFSFCENTAVTFTAVGAVNGDTYEWEILSGATTSTSTGTVAGATTTDTTIVSNGSVKLTVTTAGGCSYDITEPITVVAVPAATVSASATTVCQNDTVTLTASPAGQATYTFLLGGVPQYSGPNRTFTTAALVTTTLYTVEVVNAIGCGSTTSITISVPKLSSAGTISATSADLVLCAGDTLSANIDGDGTSGGASATLDGSLGALAYQWQISYDNGGSYQDIVGATDADLTPAELGTISQTVNIHRLAYAMNAGVPCAEEASNAIQISLDTERIPEIRRNGIGITTLTVCASEDIILSADGALAGTDTYTWYISGSEVASGTVNYTITGGTLVGGERIRLEVETIEGCTYDTDLVVIANPDPVISLTSDALTPHVICSSDDITFSVTDVPSATYYWSKSSTTTPVAVALGGSPTSTNSLTVSGLTISDGDIITVTVSYTGFCSVTDSITVNVVDMDPGTIDVTPAVLEVCSSEIPSTISSTLRASSTNGSVSITYDWEYSNDNRGSWISTGVNSPSLEFGGTLPETRIFRRVAIFSWGGVELCRTSTLLDLEIRVRDPEGGTLAVSNATVCFSLGALGPEISVTGAATGTYQWQESSDGLTFTDIPGEQNSNFTPTITSTDTTFFRRVTFSTATCSDTTDNIFTLNVSDLDPGSLSTSPTAVYCYGSQPPMLGEGTSVNGSSSLGPVTYIWQYKILGQAGGYTELSGENNRNYQPPPLFADPTNTTTSYLYQRIAVDASGCESAPSNTVTITIAPLIEPGDLGFLNVAPLNYYICEGQENPDDLVLRNATPVSSGVVTYTWQSSTDQFTWSTVPSSTSNSQLTFSDSNTPTQTTYYRVKITSGNTTPTAVSPTLTIGLRETGDAISYGEIYDLYIDGNNVRVTTSASVSTTDLIGQALTSLITTNIPGYNATYYPNENVIRVNEYSSNVSLVRTTNGVSSTLFLEGIIANRNNTEDFCTSYSNVITVNLYEAPTITQITAPFDSQIICVGEAMSPVTFQYGGSVDYVEISGIASPAFQVSVVAPGTSTYSSASQSWFVSNTTQFTISGTPTLAENESLVVRMETEGACRDEAEATYRIETVNGPDTPELIYRNVAQAGRAMNQRFQIFELADGTWVNNTICQDELGVPPTDPSLTYQFAACYSNQSSLRDVNFDWEVLPPSAISSITFSNDGNTRMIADVNVNNISSSTTFTAGEIFTITITGPDGDTDTVEYSTTALNYNNLIDALDTAFSGLDYIDVIQADRDGDGVDETLAFRADTAGVDGYFRISIQNPNNAEFLLESPVYQYPLKDNAIQIIFNPDFGTTTSTAGGVTATLRVRAESVECTGVFSDWYEVELFVVDENDPVSSLPTLREPFIRSNIIDVCEGTRFNAIPTCELTTTQNWNTIFYSAPTATSSYTYGYLEWRIEDIDSSTSGQSYPGREFQWNGGIDPDYGIVQWTQGFYGQFNVCVRPRACDASTDSDGDGFSDEGGWVCRTITINPLEGLPNIFASDLPLCPIPATGSVTSTFTSDLDVSWSVQPAGAVNSTSTTTILGRDALLVEWANGFSGTAWISAETQSCSSGIRNFTVRIPDDPVLTRTSTATNETVCQGEAITPVTFSVNGYSVIGIDDSDLPDGLIATYTPNVQSATFNINRRNGIVDNTALEYIISIEYQDYSLTVSTSASLTEITNELVDLIETSPKVASATSTIYTTSSTIEIIGADPGIRFNIATNSPRQGQFSLDQPNISITTGSVEVSGSISETLSSSSASYFGVGPDGVSQDHRFELYTISASASCTMEVGELQIFFNPNHFITTTTPTLLVQEICDGSAIDEIIFTLSGGARDYENPVWFPAEPNGIIFTPEAGDVFGATTTFTISGTINTGITTTTVYYYTLTTTGTLCDTDTVTGSIVVHPNSDSDSLDPQQGLNLPYCNGEYVDLQYEFEGIPNLTITSTTTLATLGLTESYTYTNTPSVELTVVASATYVGEIFQVEIVPESGIARSFRFVSVTGSETPTQIASALATEIEAHLQLSATPSGTIIAIESVNKSYVFWVRINRAGLTGTLEHYDDSKLTITGAVPTLGVYSLTGTITLDISETTSYSLEISSSNNRCDTVTSTTILTISPSEIIEPTVDSDLALEYCDGSSVSSPSFVLSGSATGYSVNWIPSKPNGIDFDAAQALNIGTTTFTLTGTLNTGITTTTVYYYTLTTDDINGLGCNTDSVTGTIVVHPNTASDRLDPQQGSVYTIEDYSYVNLSYDFIGIPRLSVTSTQTISDLNLSSAITYTSTPSVELTIVESATFIGEVFQVEIVEEDGGYTTYNFESITGSETPTQIAAALATELNTDLKVSASASGTTIQIEAINNDYVFWIRINTGDTDESVNHYDDSKIRITGGVPVEGSVSITGTPTLDITSTTTYSIELRTNSDRCDTVTTTTIVSVDPTEIIIPILPLDNKLEFLDNTSGVASDVFALSGSATDYTVSWSDGSPSNLSFTPAPGNVGTTTVTLSGDIAEGLLTTKVYYYTITTVGPAAIADVVTGTIVIYPNDPDEILNPLQGVNLIYCDATYVELNYQFSGIPALTITSTNTLNTLGLNTAVTYNTTPTVELTIVESSTQANEFYSIEIVEEDGTYRSHNYEDVAGTQTPTQIATLLAAEITNDPKVTATASGTSIIIEANDPNYVFWTRINVGNTSESIAHYDESKIRVSNVTEVSGVLSISGTPTLAITNTTTYTLSFETTSERVDTVTTSTLLTIDPSDYIDVTDLTDLNLEFCDGDTVSSPTFVLSGSANGYTVNWTGAGGQPNGIDFDQAANIILGTSTFTLQGTLNTGIKSTTIYPYTITTMSSDGCNNASISGSITVNPIHYIELTSGVASQQICNLGDPITPIEYTLSGGATTYNVSWSGGAIGLNVINTSSSTLTISGTVNIPGGITQTTSYTYTITTIGNTCDTATVSGVITVIPELDYTIDTLGTVNQIGASALCNDDSIQDIVFTVIGGEGSAQVSLTWTTANELENVSITPNGTNTIWTMAGVVNESETQLTSYPYQVSIYRPGSCATPVSFTGTIQVAPNPIVNQIFIQANDVTDVSCEGGSDGSIIIPTTPESDFIKRITGGQLAAQQMDVLTVSSISSLTAGDVIKVDIDGFEFEATMGAGQSTATVLEFLALQINSGVNSVNVDVVASVISTTIPPELLLTAGVAGVGFLTSSVTVVTGTNTITTLIENRVLNESLNYSYEWYNANNILIGSGPSIENLEAGIYKLNVSVNGCVSSPTTQEFTIEEPSTSIGTVSETCNGDISIPIDAYFTPTQLNQVGVTLRAELFERDVNNAYTISFDFATFNAATASNSYVVNFNGLSEGETYQLVVTDNSCAQRTTQIIGPISEELSINELLLSSTDEQCAGEGGTLIVGNNAIDGGSGSFSYIWSNGVESYNLENVIGAAPGLYSLTVTDKVLGCTATTVDFVEVEESETLIVVPADPILTINDCVDGREGRLAVNVTGGDGVNYSYEWEFTPANSSTTISLNNDSPILVPDNEIPAGLSSTGNYTVYVYDGEIADGCPASLETFTITGPTPVQFIATSSTNVTCLEGSNGTITFEVTGGIEPYKYSLNGGVPNTAVTSKVMTIKNLEAGTYNLVVGDSSSQACNPTNVTTPVEIIISQPSGTRLELSEDELIGIPCSGGTGSIRLGISGGATNSTTTNFQVFISGPDGFRKNDAVSVNATTYLIENLSTAGTYNITVSDALANSCSPTTLDVVLEEEATENLAATAIIIASATCGADVNSVSSGASIQITSFDKGDGEVAGYPLWQRSTSVDLFKFTISLNGSVAGANLAGLGVVIDGVSYDATGTISTTSIQDVASNIAVNIDAAPNLTARLIGSQVVVSGQIIDEISTLTNTSSGTGLNLNISSVTPSQETRWVEVSGLAGLEQIENLQAGIYRGILRDGSGCGNSLVQNLTQGGTLFQIDDPASLQFDEISFDEITCKNPVSTLEFRLTNGVYTLVPSNATFELTLNSVVLNCSGNNCSSVSFSTSSSATTNSTTPTSSSSSGTTAAVAVGNSFTPNFNTNKITITDLPPGDYELVVKNRQTECVAVLTFSIEEPVGISYSGETDFTIDSCFETYQEIFFDQFLIEGGTPYVNLEGESYYSLVWKYYPQDTSRSVKTINSLSNNVNFKPEAGRYELFIKDANSCVSVDENGVEIPIEFTFSKELNQLVVNGTGGTQGNAYSQPVSCEIDAEDGQINIEVVSADPDGEVPPFDIQWEKQSTNNTAFEQRLLIEGSLAGDSLEVYTIRLNEISFSYITQTENEPKESVVSELIQIIDQSSPFEAEINPTVSNEILIRTVSQAGLNLEIVSQSTRLQMIKSTSNVAVWLPLDGTNGTTNFNGFLDLDNLGEGLYRYTISSANQTVCENNTTPNSLQGVITVENENILEIREGPLVDEYLCNGQPGTLFIDIFDGDTGPLTFFYNGTPVTFNQVGTDQYLINIDDPVETASFEIYNALNCGLSREINIGNGSPLFDFSSTNFEQSGAFLAREDITFTDLSENEYDSFEFYFGDGNQTERIERNTPDPIVHEYAISGTYYVKLRIYNDLGCMEELTKTIKIGKGYSILTPNVFTPNGDIWNNTFRPVFNGLNEITLRIYDAQGALLYEEVGETGKDPEVLGVSLLGWDGLNNSSSSPYYIYTITGKTIDEEEVFRDGTFIIIN